MLIRKQKGFKMILNTEEFNELESYTLIHLDKIETELFLREANLKPFTGIKVIKYKSGDVLDELFKNFAHEHSLINSDFKKDVNIKANTGVKGNWCLIRNPDKHTITLKPRLGENFNTLNRLCIGKHQTSDFCRDCKRTSHPNNYYLDMNDSWLYEYWSNYMNSRYIKDREGIWKL